MSQINKVTSVNTISFPWDKVPTDLKVKSELSKSYESEKINKTDISATVIGGKNVIARFSSPGDVNTKISYTKVLERPLGREWLSSISLGSSLNYRNYEQKKYLQDLNSKKINNNVFTSIRRDPQTNAKYSQKKYDNGFVSHAIPATVYGYRWIYDSSRPSYYPGPSDVLFPKGELYDTKNFKGIEVNFITSSYDDNNPSDYELDIVGTNSSFYEPFSLISMTSGAETLSSRNIEPEDYNKYISNKKAVQYRTRGFSFWKKDQDNIVKSLVERNIVTNTVNSSDKSTTNFYRTSPVSLNNTARILFTDSEDETYSLSTSISDKIENEKLSEIFRSRTLVREDAINDYRNADQVISDSEYRKVARETRETIFPNRENMNLSYVSDRKKYTDTNIEKTKKSTSIRCFWNSSAENRVRPIGSSNALDYKNSIFYNSNLGITDSIFALDNDTLESGNKLAGELSYQGKDFYKNLISRKDLTESSIKSQQILSYEPKYLSLETQDSLRIPIVSDRPLEILNAKNSLVNSLSLSENYSWGTSISPYDLHRNFIYHAGSFYDKSKFKIDFRTQPEFVSYDNKVSTISSYKADLDSFNSFGIRDADRDYGNEDLSFSSYTDGEIKTSKENPKVLTKEVLPEPKISISEIENVSYNLTSRPSLQLFYQPNEFYGSESNFYFDSLSGTKIPFFKAWGDFGNKLGSNRGFSSLISEFNMSRNFDEYRSSGNGIKAINKAFLSLPGSGENTDTQLSTDSRKVKIRKSKEYSFDGAGIKKLTKYPITDNNYAWYSTRNRDKRLAEDISYRGSNILEIPEDSTFSIDNSVNTSYNITSTTGYNGLNTSKQSWYSYEPKVKKNAAARFNTEDFSKDYVRFNIDKFGNNEVIDLSSDSFAISLWYQPDEEWFEAEEKVGLLSLSSELEDFSQHISVYIKNTLSQFTGISIEDSLGGTIIAPSQKHTAGVLNNLIISFSSGQVTVYLNGSMIINNYTLSNASAYTSINKMVLGISEKRTSYYKYRGLLDEIYLFKGNPSTQDIEKIYSGGQPSNLVEFWANNELSSQFEPVLYNRLGYPSVDKIDSYSESHDVRFLNRHVFGGRTESSLFSLPGNKTHQVVLSGVNKLLPYNGLYPYQRVMQIAELFVKTYKTGTLLDSDNRLGYSQSIQSMIQPFFAPGVIFNSLRAGIECPWPIYTNASGLEPTVPYDSIYSNDTKVSRPYDNMVPSWYLNESYNFENAEFLNKYPETLEEAKKTKTYQELLRSQPKFVNNFNDEAGLVLNRVANSKISIESLKDENLYETIKKSEQKNIKKVKAYQYCVLEFAPEDMEDNSGLSLYVPGRKENLNITFRKANNLEKTGEKYSINQNLSFYDAQIEIEAYEFNVRNVEKSICSLLNVHLVDGEYRAVCLNREDESTVNPESFILDNLNLKEIDERLDASGEDRTRIAFIYIGTETGNGIEDRSFKDYEMTSVSTFSGTAGESLGITYRDKYNGPERNIDLNKVPYGQYDKPFYSGKDSLISELTGQNLGSKGTERKEEQIFLLAGDHYTGDLLELKEKYVWPSFTWNKSIPDTRFQDSINNFIDQSQEFFLKNKRPLRYLSTNATFDTIPGKTYSMEVFMRKSDNFSTIRTFSDNDGKFYGSPYRFQDSSMYRNEKELTDDLAYAPFAPAYHYGETVAKILFVAEKDKSTIEDVVNNMTIEHYNKGMEKEYSRRFGHTGEKGLKSFKNSPSYKGKNNIDSCVTLDKVVSKEWEISLKSEFPMLNYHQHTPSQSKSRGFLYDYGELPKADEGVYFGIRESVNQELGSQEMSLIKLCGFIDPQKDSGVNISTENRIGDIADEKTIKEAVVVIPYSETPQLDHLSGDAITGEKFTIYNTEENTTDIHFFKIQDHVFDEALISGKVETSVETMIDRLGKYVMPPELDFMNNKEKSPFVCYVVESEVSLKKQDLADIWQGRLPSNSISPSFIETKGASETFEHKEGAKEFFAGKKIPTGTKFMVFKLKERADENSKEKVLYNWPNDYLSILENASVNFNTISKEEEQDV